MTGTVKPSDFIDELAMAYSHYVVHDRAIPKLSDGLKPSQRIALWLARKYDKPESTIGLVGEMIGSKLYEHGNAPAEDLVSRLAAPYLTQYPLLEGEGAFGSRVAPLEGIGAARYTAIKRSEFAEKHLYIDEEILDFKYSYDGKRKVPVTFLPILPLVLANGAVGIGVGFSCKILPRKIKDLQEAVLETIETGKCTHPLVPAYERYDVDVAPLGDNRYAISGKVEIINTSKVRITELPPGETPQTYMKKLASFMESGFVNDFVNSSSDRVDILIVAKRGTFDKSKPEEAINKLGLVTMETENFTVLSPDGSTIMVFNNPQELVEVFVEWRLGVFKKRYEYLSKKLREEFHRLCLFLLAFEDTGNGSLVSRISSIKSRKTLVDEINEMAKVVELPAKDEDVQWLADLPIHRFTEEAREKADRESERVYKEIMSADKMVKSKTRRRNQFIEEVKQAI